QGMLKNRCCVLLGDLRVLLLGPPAPATPLPPLTPMSGQTAESCEAGVPVPDNNNTLTRSHHQHAGDRGAPAPAGAPGPTVGERAGWVDAAELEAALRGCSSSSDDCSKSKLEERFSLTSYTESGFRTPVCRICFQGPEHVSPRSSFVSVSNEGGSVWHCCTRVSDWWDILCVVPAAQTAAFPSGPSLVVVCWRETCLTGTGAAAVAPLCSMKRQLKLLVGGS
ncbi:unnamed protein product, partial [Tetraodon nigroviridis]